MCEGQVVSRQQELDVCKYESQVVFSSQQELAVCVCVCEGQVTCGEGVAEGGGGGRKKVEG